MLKWLSNKYVFNFNLKVWTLWDLLFSAGSLFQSLGLLSCFFNSLVVLQIHPYRRQIHPFSYISVCALGLFDQGRIERKSEGRQLIMGAFSLQQKYPKSVLHRGAQFPKEGRQTCFKSAREGNCPVAPPKSTTVFDDKLCLLIQAWITLSSFYLVHILWYVLHYRFYDIIRHDKYYSWQAFGSTNPKKWLYYVSFCRIIISKMHPLKKTLVYYSIA